MGLLGGGLGHEGAALMNGVSALTTETPKCLIAPSTMGGYSKKMAIYEPGSRPCWCPDLGLSASTAVRSKFLLFTSHSVYGIFVIVAQLD